MTSQTIQNLEADFFGTPVVEPEDKKEVIKPNPSFPSLKTNKSKQNLESVFGFENKQITQATEEPSLLDKGIEAVKGVAKKSYDWITHKGPIYTPVKKVPKQFQRTEEQPTPSYNMPQSVGLGVMQYGQIRPPVMTPEQIKEFNKPMIQFDKTEDKTKLSKFTRGIKNTVESLSSPAAIQQIALMASMPQVSSVVVPPVMGYQVGKKGTEAILEKDMTKAGEAATLAAMLATPYAIKGVRSVAPKISSSVKSSLAEMTARDAKIKTLQNEGFEYYGTMPRTGGDVWIKRDPNTGGVIDQQYVSKSGIVSKVKYLFNDIIKNVRKAAENKKPTPPALLAETTQKIEPKPVAPQPEPVPQPELTTEIAKPQPIPEPTKPVVQLTPVADETTAQLPPTPPPALPKQKAVPDVDGGVDIVKQYSEQVGDASKVTAKQQQAFLSDSIKDAMTDAPKENLTPQTVLFKVPGDGEFRIPYSMPKLQNFKAVVDKNWPTNKLPQHGPSKTTKRFPSVRPQGEGVVYYNAYKPKNVTAVQTRNPWNKKSKMSFYSDKLGVFTNGGYVIQLPKSAIKNKNVSPLPDEKSESLKKIITLPNEAVPAKFAGEYYNGISASPLVHAATTDLQHHFSYDINQVDNILTFHPDAEVSVAPNSGIAFFTSGGKTVGVVSPVVMDKAKFGKIGSIDADPQRIQEVAGIKSELESLKELIESQITKQGGLERGLDYYKSIISKLGDDDVLSLRDWAGSHQNKYIKSRLGGDIDAEVRWRESKTPEKPQGAIAGGTAAGLYQRDSNISMEPQPSYARTEPLGGVDAVQQMAAIWNAPVKYGRFRTKTQKMERAGLFYPRSGVIRVAVANDVPTATHEIAHWFDNQSAIRTLYKKHKNEILPLDYNLEKDNIKEGFAEFMRHYFMNNQRAQELAPNFYRDFTAWLKQYPEVNKRVQQTLNITSRFTGQGAESRVAGQMGKIGEEPKGTHLSKWQRFKLRTEEALFDSDAILKKAVNDMISGVNFHVSPSHDPYELKMYSLGSDARAIAWLIHGQVDFSGKRIGPSLKEILAPVSKNFDQFLRFAYSKIALARLDQGRNPGISQQDAQYVYNKYKDVPYYQETTDAMSNWYQNLVHYVVRSGGLTEKDAEIILKSIDFYLPLKRIYDETIGSGFGKGSYIMPGSAVKKMTEEGSARKVQHFLQQAVSMVKNMIAIADRTRVGNALVDLAMKSPEGKWWVREIDAIQVPNHVSIEKLNEALKKQFGFEIVDEEGKASGLDNVVTYFSNLLAYRGNDPIVIKRIDGQNRYFEIDPWLYKTLANLDVPEFGPVLNVFFKILEIPKKTIVLGATGLKFSWTIVNAFRDAITSMVNSKYPSPMALVRHLGAYKLIAKNSPEYQQWRDTGGELFNQVREDQQSLKHIQDQILANGPLSKAMLIVRHPIDFVKSVFSISETATRLGEFKVVGEQLPKERPEYTAEDLAIAKANAAAEVTLNFRKGGVVSKFLNRFIPFHNAWALGKKKFYDNFKDPKRRKKAVMAALVGITLPTLAAYLSVRKDKQYRQMPWWERVGFANVKIGDKIVKFPLPQDELGFLFGSLLVGILDSIDQQDPSIIDSYAEQYFRQSIIPPFLPAFAGPAVEVWANKSFFRDRPLMNEYMKTLKPEVQINEFTDPLIIEIATQMGVSPIYLNQLVYGYTGGLGTSITGMSKFVTPMTKYGFKEREKEAADLPVIGRWFARKNRSGQALDDFFKEWEDQQSIKNTVRSIMNKAKKTGVFGDEQQTQIEAIEKKYGFDPAKYEILKVYYGMIKDLLDQKDFDGASDMALEAMKEVKTMEVDNESSSQAD